MQKVKCFYWNSSKHLTLVYLIDHHTPHSSGKLKNIHWGAVGSVAAVRVEGLNGNLLSHLCTRWERPFRPTLTGRHTFRF